MTRLEKCELLKSKGFTYDKETGKIFGERRFEIKRKNKDGYILIGSNHLKGHLLAHHFAWYMIYGNVNFKMIDHINRNPNDNRICNLRDVSNQKNMFNTNAKGYTYKSKSKKYIAQIKLDYKNIYLGSYDSEEEARQAYISAKSVYHRLI
jgi:hypothetical protein